MGRILLRHGTVFQDPEQAPTIGNVTINGDSIESVGLIHAPDDLNAEGMATMDCNGMSILAGFWNSHVHFLERKWSDASHIPTPELGRQLEDFAAFGFTNVFDLSSLWENTRVIRDRILSFECAGPQVYSTGPGLLPRGAAPASEIMAMMGFMEAPLQEVSTPQEALQSARSLIDAGVDGIKLFVSGPPGRVAPLDLATMTAAVAVAHESGKLVFAHPNTVEDVGAALDAGVDVIAHTTPRSPWNSLESDFANGRYLTPTLGLWAEQLRHDRLSTGEQLIETAGRQLLRWREAGGSILFGTDYGAVRADPRVEYQLMASAGMTFADILASLTTTPGRMFAPHRKIGRVAPTYEADVVVVKDDPRTNACILADVACVIRGGRVIFGRLLGERV